MMERLGELQIELIKLYERERMIEVELNILLREIKEKEELKTLSITKDESINRDNKIKQDELSSTVDITSDTVSDISKRESNTKNEKGSRKNNRNIQ